MQLYDAYTLREAFLTEANAAIKEDWKVLAVLCVTGPTAEGRALYILGQKKTKRRDPRTRLL